MGLQRARLEAVCMACCEVYSEAGATCATHWLQSESMTIFSGRRHARVEWRTANVVSLGSRVLLHASSTQQQGQVYLHHMRGLSIFLCGRVYPLQGSSRHW